MTFGGFPPFLRRPGRRRALDLRGPQACNAPCRTASPSSRATSPGSRSTPSSMPPITACSAAAGSTARSTARRVRAYARPARQLGGCDTGEAKITPGFKLPARYVIHTVGPVWGGGERGEDRLLAACYRNALALALEHGLASIAYPAISTGAYGFPPDRAALDCAAHRARHARGTTRRSSGWCSAASAPNRCAITMMPWPPPANDLNRRHDLHQGQVRHCVHSAAAQRLCLEAAAG